MEIVKYNCDNQEVIVIRNMKKERHKDKNFIRVIIEKELKKLSDANE